MHECALAHAAYQRIGGASVDAYMRRRMKAGLEERVVSERQRLLVTKRHQLGACVQGAIHFDTCAGTPRTPSLSQSAWQGRPWRWWSVGSNASGKGSVSPPETPPATPQSVSAAAAAERAASFTARVRVPGLFCSLRWCLAWRSRRTFGLFRRLACCRVSRCPDVTSGYSVAVGDVGLRTDVLHGYRRQLRCPSAWRNLPVSIPCSSPTLVLLCVRACFLPVSACAGARRLAVCRCHVVAA